MTLLKAVWESNQGKPDELKYLINMMVKFDLICKIAEDSTLETDNLQGCYFVPCCSQPELSNEEKHDEDNKDDEFEFIIDFNMFLPDGFLHRLYVRMASWSMEGPKIPCNPIFHCREMLFYIDELHRVVMTNTIKGDDAHRIKVLIFRLKPQDALENRDKCISLKRDFITYLKDTLEDLKKTWARRISYSLGLPCTRCSYKGKRFSLISLEAFLACENAAHCGECNGAIYAGRVKQVFAKPSTSSTATEDMLEVSHTGSEVIQSEKGIEGTVPTDEGDIAVQWEFIADTPPDLILRDDEVVISDGIRFFPSGATFSTPVKITMEHSAYFTNPKQAKIVFYTGSKGSRSFERISASSTGCPRCDIRKTDLDLYVDHFCQWWIVAVMSRYFVGMKVNCKPYVELPLRRGTYYLRLCIYDDLPEVCKRVEKEMMNYKELHPAEPLFVEWKSGNVVVTLLEQQDEHEREIDQLEIREKSLYRVNRRRLAFLMKPPEEMESQKLMRLTVAQDNSQTDPAVIRLDLHYFDGILQLRNRSRVAAAEARPSQLDLEMDQRLNELAEHMPDGKYVSFCGKIGIAFNTSKSILEKNKNDYCKATRECLADWKNRTAGTLDDLKQILKDAGLRGLLCHLQETAL